MGPRAGLDGRKSRPHRDSIPELPARSSVAIPTELPGPHINKYQLIKLFFGYFHISATELTVLKT